MTRKEELKGRASKFMEVQDRYPYRTSIDMLHAELLQVEREVLERVKTVVAKKQTSIHPEHTLEFKSGAGNVLYDVEQWLNSQQQELT